MSRQIKLAAFFSLIFTTAIFAQAPAGSAQDQPDPQQQVRETFQMIIQNMIAKGMDPQELFQQLRDGTDPADVEKQLIDKGVVDQQTLNDLHGNMQKASTGRIRDQLDVTDSEWAALQPLISKVLTASEVLNRVTGQQNMNTAGFVSDKPSPAVTNLARAARELRAAAKEPATPADKYAVLLKNFRDAREAVRAELEAARKDLTSVLTVRQESVLTTLGILE